VISYRTRTPRPYQCACDHCRLWRGRCFTAEEANGTLVEMHRHLDHDKHTLLAALVDAVILIDKLQRGAGSWTLPEVKKLEAIRLLSLGV
jgi:hypothetical protein